MADQESIPALVQRILNIEAAYKQRQAELEQEMGSWRQEAMNLSARVNQVESELGAAQAAAAAAESRAVELERALQHVAREKDAMAVARDDAVAQYNQLRQSTIQLVNFKNSISTMVGSAPLDPAIPVASASGAPPPAAGASRVDVSAYTNASYEYGAARAASHAYAAPAAPSAAPQTPPRAHSTPLRNAHGSPPAYAAPPRAADAGPIDAAAFYQEVKASLSPSDFRRFADNIKRLNSGQQSIETTLDEIRGILHDPHLYAKLHSLIKQAVMEAAREAAELGVASVMDSAV